MEKIIDLLKSEREKTNHLIKFLKEEIENGKKAIKKLQSPEFIEKHKESSNWTESWTIEQFIKLNVCSNNRAITEYTEKLEEANEYLRQIESALAVLCTTSCGSKGVNMNYILEFSSSKNMYYGRKAVYHVVSFKIPHISIHTI